MKATTNWIKGFESVIDDNNGHSYTIDLPEKAGGENLGATALDMCVMSLSGCVVTIFALIAKKMRFEFSELKVDVDAQKGSKTIENSDVTLYIKSDASDSKIEQCLDMTMKTCPVGVLFDQAGVKTTHKIVKL